MIEKEFRALLPLWLAAVSGMLLARAAGQPFESLGAVAFVLGAAALGGFAFGHEYVYRTMPLLLAQPVPRHRVWLAKMAVLAIFLSGLIAAGIFSQPFGRAMPFASASVLALAAALGIAPWLALVSRSALGGGVFTVSIAGMLMVTAQLIGMRLHGLGQQTDDFIRTLIWAGILGLSAVGLILGWRTFANLEAIEGRGAEVTLPFSGVTSAVSTPRRSRPIWRLVSKELRLQQMTWVLAAIYAVSYFSVVLFTTDRTQVDGSVMLITLLHTGVISLMIGALAGGEERHLGVHDAQLLLPVSSRRQWLVKIAACLALGVVLTIVLPAILTIVLQPEGVRLVGRRGLIEPSTFMLLLSLVTLGLYVSVVAGSGVRGLIAAIPVGMAMVYLFGQFILPLAVRVDRWIPFDPAPRNSEGSIIAVAFGLFLVVVLRLALTNYRWLNRSPLHLARHAAIAVVALTACFVLLAAIGIR